MLKILKDVTIRHDGKEIHCKAGQIVNVKASFDVNDERADGIEKRYCDKFRDNIKRVNLTPGSTVNVESMQPEYIHNQVEQERRENEKKAMEPEEISEPEDLESEEHTQEVTEEESMPKREYKKRGRKGGRK